MGEKDDERQAITAQSLDSSEGPMASPGWAKTTEPRSWAELVETLQGGLAVLDDEWRITYVSDRFLPVLGPAASMEGREIGQLLPALSADDPRALTDLLNRGDTVEFVQQFWGPDDDPLWFRVTVHPTRALGRQFSAVVFAMDTTPTSSALALLHETTLSLTQIEGELHRRVARDVHDGPIQLLAALMIRLDLVDDPGRTSEVRQIAERAISEFRAAVAEFAPHDRQTSPGQLLQTWINPFVDRSRIIVRIEDHRHSVVDQPTTQAAFVFVYELVRAALLVGRDRIIRVSLSEEKGGDRIVLTIDRSTGDAIHVGHVGAQYRAVSNFARGLGGSISTSMDADHVRTLSAWLPRVWVPESVDLTGPASSNDRASGGTNGSQGASSVACLPSLSNEAWEEIVHSAPERFLEFDSGTNFSFANTAQEELFGVAAEQLIGQSVESVFTADALAKIEPAFERMDLGEVIDVEWERENAFGELRNVRLRGSPRIDKEGRWLGALCTVDDLTEADMLQKLLESALADLATARHVATQRSLLLLEEPLAAIARLVDLLRSFEDSAPDRFIFRSIRRELEFTLPNVRQSLGLISTPDMSANDLGHALRTSLRSALADSSLKFVDETDNDLSVEDAEVLFRIAREAVINAVSHGKAGLISITLRTVHDGHSMDVHDDGIGIRPQDLVHKSGHLGTRAMHDRARERGGNCRIEADRRGGTLVSVWLPENDRRSSLLRSALGRESP